ncbi:MAG: hypothetical protein IPI66_07295 [Chitinophagaceae bacterium]|nr:hypothetical protein [Chitinophagaceae bacterium]
MLLLPEVAATEGIPENTHTDDYATTIMDRSNRLSWFDFVCMLKRY